MVQFLKESSTLHLESHQQSTGDNALLSYCPIRPFETQKSGKSQRGMANFEGV